MYPSDFLLPFARRGNFAISVNETERLRIDVKGRGFYKDCPRSRYSRRFLLSPGIRGCPKRANDPRRFLNAIDRERIPPRRPYFDAGARGISIERSCEVSRITSIAEFSSRPVESAARPHNFHSFVCLITPVTSSPGIALSSLASLCPSLPRLRNFFPLLRHHSDDSRENFPFQTSPKTIFREDRSWSRNRTNYRFRIQEQPRHCEFLSN